MENKNISPTQGQPIKAENPQPKGFLAHLRHAWKSAIDKKRKHHVLPQKEAIQKTPSTTAPHPQEKILTATKIPQEKSIPLTPESKTNVQKNLSKEEKKQLQKAEKTYQEGLVAIKDVIAPSSMEVKYNHVRIGSTIARSFFIYAYPRYINVGWLSPIINFDITMDISMFIYPSYSASILKVLRNKVAQMQSSISMNQSRGMVRDPGLEASLQDAEELRDKLQRGEEKFFQFGIYFTVYSDDLTKLNKISTQLESLFGSKMVLSKPADMQQEHALNSTLPLCMDEIEIQRNMSTEPLSTTFPFTSSELTSNEGILYGLNRHNDSLIIFDRFQLENANSVVFAKSGAGKSYAVKLEILRLLMMGVDVIVVDPEKEYQSLSDTIGGTYLDISLNANRRINPFDLPIQIKDQKERPGNLLRSAVINLHGLFKLMLGNISDEESAVLDKSLLECYALKGITMETEDPGALAVPTMEDFHDILSSMKGAESLARRVEKYTTGTYGGIFNKPTNIDLQSGLVIFNIRDLENELRPIAHYILLNYIWNRVRSDLKKRVLVIDEAWSLLQHEDSARFLYGLVKRARKYWLGITTITQDVEDFMNSPFGKPIITNSSLQLLLKQAPSAVESMQKIFHLTEGEKYLLLNSKIGQGLFFAGSKHVAVQVIASYTEDKIVTTKPEEVIARQQELSDFETSE